MLRALAIGLMIILLVIFAVHMAIPLVAGAITLSIGIWTFLIASVIGFCVLILLAFVITGIGLVIASGAGFVWLILTLVLFPFLLPLLLPLFLVMIFISYANKRRQAEHSAAKRGRRS